MTSEHDEYAKANDHLYAFSPCPYNRHVVIMESRSKPGEHLAAKNRCRRYNCECCKKAVVGGYRSVVKGHFERDVEKGRQPFVMHFDEPEWEAKRRKRISRRRPKWVKFDREDGTSFVVGTVDKSETNNDWEQWFVDEQVALRAIEDNCKIIVGTVYVRETGHSHKPITTSRSWKLPKYESKYRLIGSVAKHTPQTFDAMLKANGVKSRAKHGLFGWFVSFKLENAEQSALLYSQNIVFRKKANTDIRKIAPAPATVGVMVPVRHKDTLLSATYTSGQRGMDDKNNGVGRGSLAVMDADFPYKPKQNTPVAGQRPTTNTLLSSSNQPTHDPLRPQSWNDVIRPKPVSWPIGQPANALGTSQQNASVVTGRCGTTVPRE